MVFIIEGLEFDMGPKYRRLSEKAVGRGAYGVVGAVENVETGEKLAVKRVANAFEDLVDGKRVVREIRLLRQLRHENINYIKDLTVRTHDDEDDVYIVTELMDTDLHKVIYSSQPLLDDHVQFFIYQVLRGLKYLHSAHVLHRDLKPGNLLVNGNCDLKICDFGLARADAEENKLAMTSYVVTRWYRAPELLFLKEYTGAIDIWSVGCIFAELLGRKPLFQGRDFRHQLSVIFEKLGKPNRDQLTIVPNPKVREYIASLDVPEKARHLSTWLPNASPSALDLLDKMLRFVPAERMTATDALAHPYLAEYADPADEPLADHTFSFEFENTELTKRQLQELLYSEVQAFNTPMR
jgi:serine/threonine protein kinase